MSLIPDVNLGTVPDEALTELEATIGREMSDSRGLSYVHRQALAFAYVRTLVERAIRERERALGLR